MKNLLIATTNKGKFREFQEILSPAVTCHALPPGLPEAEEDGDTYAENAEKKARHYYEKLKEPVLADDTGLEVDGLDGKPGVHSARFAGPITKWPERWAFLQEKIGTKSRKARFKCVLCFFDGKNTQFFEGITEGEILTTSEGTEGFGYDPIFYSNDLRKSFGVATSKEKNEVSHRARAIRKFLDWYKLA